MRLRAISAGLAVIGATALAVPMTAPMAAAAAGPSFTHGVLPPPPAGSTTAANQAAEPQIRADQAGHFYISSENGLGSGTDAWTTGARVTALCRSRTRSPRPPVARRA